MKIKILHNPNYFVFIFFLCLITEGVLAQQEGQQTLFMYNALTINPGVAGSRGIPTLTLTTRNQWVGIKGAPVQQNLSFHTPLLSKRLGFGMTLGNRNIGIFNTQTSAISISYSPIKTENFQIRIGLQGSAKRLTVKYEDAEQLNIISNERRSQTDLRPQVLGNFGMGLFMAYKDCYFGFSVPFYYSNILRQDNLETATTAITLPHYYVIGGLMLPLLDKVSIKTSGIIKKVANAPWGVEVSSSLVFNEKVSIGAAYRAGKTNLEDIGESMDFLIFYQISNKFGIGGAYDYNLSPLKKYTDGSFEVVVRYDLKQSELRFSNPRVF